MRNALSWLVFALFAWLAFRYAAHGNRQSGPPR